MIHRLSDEDRERLGAAGFPRAAPVEIDGVGLLVDDMVRLLIDGRFLVLAFAELPPRSRKREGRKNR